MVRPNIFSVSLFKGAFLFKLTILGIRTLRHKFFYFMAEKPLELSGAEELADSISPAGQTHPTTENIHSCCV